ncbi:hypothetical protein TCAL_05655 [Tigriopus californicus]|uniref:Syndecan/Neurexin domain-containing protein n=1 Tax=Tigriopus californicus TaxID=6832 RepID=A0A553PBI2_TIGCA|nr:uncharacterized protein LOC131877240 [Tigriopus californicus]TRY75051.1 hypothetical protein TCAL_05655 [Tigriopus californicus]|eukprot:TCALIF_05655-PA protein Name:"Protein of unknown function" AED:0.25 eAED:0.25 QI:0/-1/0/1/-1/1/1/0/216
MKSGVILLAACWAFCVTQTSMVQGLPQVGAPQSSSRQPQASTDSEVTESEAPDLTTLPPNPGNELNQDHDENNEEDTAGITTTFNPDSGLDPRGDTDVTTSTMPTTSSPSNGTTAGTTESTTITSNTTESTTPMTTPPSTTAGPTNATTVTSTGTSTATAIPVTVTMPSPDENRGFEGWSFFGGIVLTLVVFAIGFVGFKYYKIRGSAHGGKYSQF